MKRLIKSLFVFILHIYSFEFIYGQNPPQSNIPFFIFKKGMLTVSEDGNYIKKYNKPFLYSAFTEWNFLYEYDLHQSLRLIEIIKSKGFEVFQFSVFPSDIPVYNRMPFINGNLMKPDSVFFNFLDTIIKFSREKDLILAISLYWNTGENIIENKYVNNRLSISQAFKYAQWMAQRYENFPNIIWIVGGNALVNNETYPIWEAMGSGIRSIDNEHLITFLGVDEKTSIKYSSSSWLSFNSININKSNIEFAKIESLLNEYEKQKITKPMIVTNLPCKTNRLEGNNDSLITFNSDNIWKYNIWTFFTISSGINYFVCNKNNHEIFDHLLNNKSIDSLIFLFKSRPWYTKKYNKKILKNNTINSENQQIAITGDGFSMIYLPEGGQTEIDIKKASLNCDIAVYWYSILDGKIIKADTVKSNDIKNYKFISPLSDNIKPNILLIDDIKKNFPFPGTKEYEPIMIEKNKKRMRTDSEKNQLIN